jgi:hypothetical protein
MRAWSQGATSLARANSEAAKIEAEAPAEVEAEEAAPAAEAGHDGMITAATIGVVGVGVILFEAALLPGLILGVAATLAPKFVPKIGEAVSPIFKSTVRGAYKVGRKAREAAAEAQEHMGDILAEVDAESGVKAKEAEAAAA